MTQKSRRDFIRASSLLVASGAVTGGLSIARSAHALGMERMRIGLVGCGRAGKEAAACALAVPGVPIQLAAMADVFGDRIQAAYRQLYGQHADKIDVPAERRFVGLDAYRQLLATDVDLVLLATPPGFRPLHFEAAVAAGKHVFMEMPVAVDAPGVRRVLRIGTRANDKNLAVAVRLQHRHQPAYRETIARLKEGVIGAPMVLRVYRNVGGLRMLPRHPRQSELEYQLRNWPRFPWLSGDQIVERHIHNLDVGNWLMGAFPLEVTAQAACDGGQNTDSGCVRTCDQFFCEFVYPGGTPMFSQCRQAPNCWNNVSEHVHAAAGRADISGGKIYDTSGARIWQAESPRGNAQQQFDDLIATLRSGHFPNETELAAKSTLTAIMGRTAAYSGRPTSWAEVFQSQAALADPECLTSLADPPPVAAGSAVLPVTPLPSQHVFQDGIA